MKNLSLFSLSCLLLSSLSAMERDSSGNDSATRDLEKKRAATKILNESSVLDEQRNRVISSASAEKSLSDAQPKTEDQESKMNEIHDKTIRQLLSYSYQNEFDLLCRMGGYETETINSIDGRESMLNCALMEALLGTKPRIY